MEISQLIKKERLKREWTQEDLSKKLHISRQSISKWESGTALPTTEQIIKLSNIFDLSLDILIKGDYDMENKVIKDSKNKFFWWENEKARTYILVIYGGIVPVLFLMKFVLHMF